MDQNNNLDQSKSWKLKLIEQFGIKNYLIQKFVFRPPETNYLFDEDPNTNLYKFFPFYNSQKFDSIYKDPFLKIRAYIISTDSIQIEKKKLGCYVPLIHMRITLPTSFNLRNKTPKEVSQFSQTSQNLAEDERSLMNSQTLSLKNPNDSEITLQSNSTSQKKKNKSIGKPQKILILYSHGNASDLGDVYFFGDRMMKEYDVDFIAYDYSGYGLGLNIYEISEKQIYQDVQFVLSFCVEHLNYELNQIILWGFSLGSGPTVEIASKFSALGGVVLQSPLASIKLWLESSRSNINGNEEDTFCNINKIQAIKSRILMFHGEEDTIIPPRHSKLIYDKYLSANANSQCENIEYFTIPKRNHNNLQQDIECGEGEVGKQVSKFLREVNFDREKFANMIYQRNNSIDEMTLKEIHRIKQKIENSQRETTLLKLMADDYKLQQCGQRTNQISRSEIKGSQKSVIKPVEDLENYNQKIIKAKSPSTVIQDYRSIINAKPKSIISKPRKPPTWLQKFTQFGMCMCNNNDDSALL